MKGSTECSSGETQQPAIERILDTHARLDQAYRELQAEQTPDAGRKHGKGREKIEVLIVDDDIQVRNVIADLLALDGIQVTVAGDGAEAWQALCRRRFDFVLTDLLMPFKDGFDLIREIIRNFPQVRIVAISGSHSSIRFLDSMDEYADIPVLPKPFDQADLLVAMAQARPAAAPLYAGVR